MAYAATLFDPSVPRTFAKYLAISLQSHADGEKGSGRVTAAVDRDFWARISQKRVMVVGDVMLDTWLTGDVHRISPEAPVPVVSLTSTTHHLGGAANVALNVASLGASAVLLGVTGEDGNGQQLDNLLGESEGITPMLLRTPERPTTTKTRLQANNHQIARIDQESTLPIDQEDQQWLLDKIDIHISSCDCVIVSDYAKGVVQEFLMRGLTAAAKRTGKPLLVDPKNPKWQLYQGASLITPNWQEFCVASRADPRGTVPVEPTARQLLKSHQLGGVLITQAEKGMTLITEHSSTHFPARLREVADVSGAGDTVIATMAVALAAGLDLHTSTSLANTAAGISVSKPGTATVSSQELASAIEC